MSHFHPAHAVTYGRTNGWTCPWHPFQFIGWFFLLLFGVAHFSIIVYYIPLEWNAAAVIVCFQQTSCANLNSCPETFIKFTL